MKRAAFAFLLVACASEPRAETVSIPTALPSPPPIETSAPALRPTKSSLDTADFTSGRGLVHLTREGPTATGSFGASGVMTCAIGGDRFDCHWYESSSDGLAVFQRKPDGTLEGTWGAGTSADDRGAWTLAPVARSGRTPFDGAWDTNFGEAIVRASDVSPGNVSVVYRDGTMQCEQKSADMLRCVWTEGASHGQAELKIESPRVMRGTWGNDQSATDGGAWLFVRR